MRDLVSFSGGLGSFMAGYLVMDAGDYDLIFCDTKTEDEDLYRFVNEVADKIFKKPIVTLADGRDIWEIFEDESFMGNSRIDPCSKILKRKLFRKYIEENYTPENSRIVVGIGWQEKHRLVTMKARYDFWPVFAPLCEGNYIGITHDEIIDVLDKYNIEPPRLYDMGFEHNNCGGFCVKSGQRQMKLLLEKFPERYQWHEERQEKLFSRIGDHGFIRKTTNGVLEYLSLKQFRKMVEDGASLQLFNEGGCNCFV